MQRCPYLHEMKERLLSQPTPTDSLDMERLDGTPVKEPNLHTDYPAHTNPGVIPDPPEMPPDSLIGTVVKVRQLAPPSHFRFSIILFPSCFIDSFDQCPSYNKILNRKVFTSNRRIIFSWKSSGNVTSRSRDNIEILDKGIALRKIIWNTCRKDEATDLK